MDGASLSYRHPRSGEWAHDVRDPLREALLVSIEPAWDLRPPQTGQACRWLEIGFGRGMVSAVALKELRARGIQPQSVQVDGAEPHPEWLQPWPALPEELREYAPWWGAAEGQWQLDSLQAEVRLVAEAAPECFTAGLARQSAPGYDWIFLDLFSPGKHGEEWRPGLLEELTRLAAPGATLTSYCCARTVREQLAALGWQAKRLRRRGLRDTLCAQLAPHSPQD